MRPSLPILLLSLSLTTALPVRAGEQLLPGALESVAETDPVAERQHFRAPSAVEIALDSVVVTGLESAVEVATDLELAIVPVAVETALESGIVPAAVA